ncbi:hypothetical protein J132_07340 [Termitomyces sp. J132]|nr:hypothetical protein C0989_000371 [Termitomyces sp. Mn162]KAH0582351.1 hypothetical protein H2248_010300 [Termitomyces sp. 'cryptogamus']KNZ74290.1 hypothetical protein J132_07340 [Termitomyces sp. J132]
MSLYEPEMGLPRVVFFDAESLLEDSPTSSVPTSSSSDDSISSSDISTSATTLAGDFHESFEHDPPQKDPYIEPLHCTTQVPPRPTRVIPDIQSEHRIHPFPAAKSCRDVSEILTLEDALLWRPLHVLPHTIPPPKFCMDTPFDKASIRPTLSHVRGLQRYENCVRETVSQWPYGINPSSLNKALPALPTHRKRVWCAIQSTFSHLLQCRSKENSPQPISSSVAPASDQTIHPAPTLKTSQSAIFKPSSQASLVFRQNSSSLKSGSTAHAVGAKQSRAYLCKQQLRRSRSFSGYPNIVVGIDIADEEPLPVHIEPTVDEDEEMDEIVQEGFAILSEVARVWNAELMVLDDDLAVDDDEEMDQVTKEAFEMLREVYKTWRFEPLSEDDPAFRRNWETRPVV